MMEKEKLNEKHKEEVPAPGVYKKPTEGDGVVIALPGGSGWSIHVTDTGNIEVEGPLVIN
jgi:hypothetical protein